MKATQNKKADLRIDNISAHGNLYSVRELSNAIVEFLSPSTTSKMQTLDAVLIQTMKLRDRVFQMQLALDLWNRNLKSIYKIDILPAMQTVKMKWKNLEAEIISSCWQHTKLEGNNGVKEYNLLDRDEHAVRNAIERLVHCSFRMLVAMLLKMSGEDEHFQDVSDDMLLSQKIQEELNGDKGMDDEDDTSPLHTSRQATLCALALLKRYAVA